MTGRVFDISHGTGKDPGGVLKNLEAILSSKTPVELRLTLVPGFNDSPADLRAIARFLSSMPRTPPVTLLPFHRLATSKQVVFGVPYPYADRAAVGPRKLDAAARTLRRAGVHLTAGF